jgi:DNA-binding transcriptional LysR family regulator
MRGSHIRSTEQPWQMLSSRVDLQLLELFDWIYRLRNLTAAGAQMGLSQPTVSRGLARLRDAYGDALFIRQPRGVLPTPFCDSLAQPLGTALAIVRGTVERPRFDPAIDRRHFRIAMSDIGERFFLPRLVSALAVSAPGVTCETVSPSRPELTEGLAGGEIDLVAGFLPPLGKQVRSLRLFQERFIHVARRDHPVVRGTLRKEQLRQLPHVIASPPGTPHALAVERVLTTGRVRVPVVLRVRSFLCVPPIVAQTDLVAAVPSNLAAMMAAPLGLQLIESPLQIPGFEVSIAWHDRFHHDPAIEWLRATFIRLFPKTDFWTLPG